MNKVLLPLLLLLPLCAFTQERYLHFRGSNKTSGIIFEEDNPVIVQYHDNGKIRTAKGKLLKVGEYGFYVKDTWVALDSVQRMAKNKRYPLTGSMAMVVGGSLLIAAIPKNLGESYQYGVVQYVSGQVLAGNGVIRIILRLLQRRKWCLVKANSKLTTVEYTSK